MHPHSQPPPQSRPPAPAAEQQQPTPRAGWIDLPNTYQSHLPGFSCFGCSDNNPSGLRLRMQVHSSLPLFRTQPFVFEHALSGFPFLAQGGLQGAAMDCLAEWACMYLSRSIGVTTRFSMTFERGVPAAPPTSLPDDSVAHVRDADVVAPQAVPLQVQVVCSARPQMHPRQLVLDLRLESAAGSMAGTVYSRGVVHMLLPSAAQVTRLFGKEDRQTAQQIQDSLNALPRPNEAIMPKPLPSSPATSDSAAASKQQRRSAASAANRPGAASAGASPSALAALPITDSDSASWVPVPDALGAFVPGYNCFGCGVNNIRGLQCRFELHGGSGVVRSFFCPGASLAGFPGMLHGGAALVPMDCAASWAVMIHIGQLGLTTHLETVYKEAAPVPRLHQRRRRASSTAGAPPSSVAASADPAAAAAPSFSDHAHGKHCGHHSHSRSAALMDPSESISLLMVQAQLVSIDAAYRSGVVLASLYDVSSPAVADTDSSPRTAAAATPPPPRLCMSARLRFSFASAGTIERLMGEQFVQPVGKAMARLQQFKEDIEQRRAHAGLPPMASPSVEDAKPASAKL